MRNLEKIKEHIRGLMNEERFAHSLGVMDLSGELARIYNVDEKRASLAGLIHDAAKQLPEVEMRGLLEKAYEGREPDRIVFENKSLWHGPAGSVYVRENFGADDEICSAVFYHTIGKENMTMLEKIVFLADCIEVGRDREFDWAKATREIAKTDIDRAILIATNKSLQSIIKRNLIIHPGSVNLRNGILRSKD